MSKSGNDLMSTPAQPRSLGSICAAAVESGSGARQSEQPALGARAGLDILRAPPPPPPPPALPSAKALEVNTTEAAKANQEAQMVLRGILNPTLEIQCPDIAHDLHKQLARSHIHVLEKTYCLMVETCIASGDLRGASDFLMKMEAAGHCADSSLLDKVMDLYTESRSDSTGACNGAGGPGRQAGPGPGAGRRGNMWSEHDADDYGD
mmetsp:Transcript_49005/g.138469  ORF Transcript_49005/g.138469 Transcript_49005/m.138469 type:complete len:207 (-) Transcript_49005:105-725(-)